MTLRYGLPFLLAAAFLHSAAADGTCRALALPPRVQWNANRGYCGEVSLISAGLYFGQYCSQYQARDLASPRTPQNEPASQLLPGVNARRAAAAMRLQSVEWRPRRGQGAEDFLAWVKSQILLGHPVIIGLFANEARFYGDTDPGAGDTDYDHIVLVTGVRTERSGDDSGYHAGDTIIFSDHGLWAPAGRPLPEHRSTFADFLRDRAAANAAPGPVYSLKAGGPNYGIAITGVMDRDRETVPVRLTTRANAELPEMEDGASTPPAASPIDLVATVEIPDPSVPYHLYLYNDFASVPEARFNANASRAARVWKIPAGAGRRHTIRLGILSNEVAVFRAVRATAP